MSDRRTLHRTRKNPPPAAFAHGPRASKKSRPTKTNNKSITDDLICAITHELPFDPVTAEDGRVYERSAIETHIRSKLQAFPVPRELRSPVTNERMGPKLLPAPQTKSLIETLIEHGSIKGDLLEAWKAREAQKKAAGDLLKKAEGGNASAMYKVYENSLHGTEFFRRDVGLAYKWLEKAYAAGSFKATADKGLAHINGTVLRRNTMEGMVLIARAAESGSDFAAYYLGHAYAEGGNGLSVNKTEAVFWLRKALSGDCSYRHASDYVLEKANAVLVGLTNIPAHSSDEDSDDTDRFG